MASILSFTIDDVTKLLTAVAAVGAMILSWRTTIKIEQVHKATNSMKDELVKVTGEAEHAKGVKQGMEESKNLKS